MDSWFLMTGITLPSLIIRRRLGGENSLVGVTTTWPRHGTVAYGDPDLRT